MRSTTRTLRAHAIRSGWFIQLGYLGETWEDILMKEFASAEHPLRVTLMREGKEFDVTLTPELDERNGGRSEHRDVEPDEAEQETADQVLEGDHEPPSEHDP